MTKYFVAHFVGTAVGFVTHQAPTVVGTYETVRHGELVEFTINDLVEGQTFLHTGVDGRECEYQVVFSEITRGSAEIPDEYVFIGRAT